MATVGENTAVALIGEAAGKVWHYLCENGSVALTKLARDVDLPRDLVMQAIGWLAREDKIVIDEEARRKTIGLR